MLYQTYANYPSPRLKAGTWDSTVLIVDDDEQFRDLAKGMLEPAGFRVIEAENVEQCLIQLQSQSVDVILLDIVMPGRDGIEATGDIRNASPGSKIVTVSGARNSEVYLAASAYLGADASLGKSRIASLCALLQVLLDPPL
jgi:CheY-like chemotaxis protein